MPILKLDFVKDWTDLVRAELAAAHYAVPPTVGYEELCQRFLNLQLRLIPTTPRKVFVAKALTCPADHQAGYDQLRQRVEKGDNLRPYLSRTLIDLDFDDMLLNDW